MMATLPPLPGNVNPPAHPRHNHDSRRYGGSSSFSETTGTDTSNESVTIPADLVAEEQAQEDQTAGLAEQVQDVVPHRPLGL